MKLNLLLQKGVCKSEEFQKRDNTFYTLSAHAPLFTICVINDNRFSCETVEKLVSRLSSIAEKHAYLEYPLKY